MTEERVGKSSPGFGSARTIRQDEAKQAGRQAGKWKSPKHKTTDERSLKGKQGKARHGLFQSVATLYILHSTSIYISTTNHLNSSTPLLHTATMVCLLSQKPAHGNRLMVAAKSCSGLLQSRSLPYQHLCISRYVDFISNLGNHGSVLAMQKDFQSMAIYFKLTS